MRVCHERLIPNNVSRLLSVRLDSICSRAFALFSHHQLHGHLRTTLLRSTTLLCILTFAFLGVIVLPVPGLFLSATADEEDDGVEHQEPCRDQEAPAPPVESLVSLGERSHHQRR